MAGRKGRSGGKPKPRNTKVLHGNFRKDRDERPRRVSPAKGVPKPPAHLSKTARAEWRRLIKPLGAAGLVTLADRATFAAYCVAYGRWADAESKLKQISSWTQMTPNGYEQISTLLTIANRAMGQMRQFSIEFGLTPSSRVKVGTDGDGEEKGKKEEPVLDRSGRPI